MINLGLSLVGQLLGSVTPAGLLGPGSTAWVWLDPSDLTTMFQDAAGTTPVTAPAQPVGLVLDKSQGLVLGSQLVTNGTFDTDTAWVKGQNWTISSGVASASASPVGANLTQLIATQVGRTYQITYTATVVSGGVSAIFGGVFGIARNVSGTYTEVFVATGTSTTIGVQVRLTTLTGTIDNISVRELPGFHATQSTAANRPTYGVVPSRGRVNILNATATLATQTRSVTAAQHTLSFRGTGTVTLSGASTAGPLVGTGANDIVSLTFTPTAGNLTLTVSGAVNDAQLELGAARGAYQLVADASGFNVTDPAGFPSYPLHYLFFGGDLDPRWLQTATITPNADKVQVFAGVRKLSDAALGIVVESSVASSTNNGTTALFAPHAASNPTYSFRSRGTSQGVPNSPSTFAAPITNVVSGLGDISGDLATLRVNGTQVAQSTDDQGTGNFLAYPLFIGRRGGTSTAFNGQLFSLIVRFSTSNLDASLVSQAEKWVAQKTGLVF